MGKAKTPRERITAAVLKLKHPTMELAPTPEQVIDAIMPEVRYLMKRAAAKERGHLVGLYEGIIADNYTKKASRLWTK